MSAAETHDPAAATRAEGPWTCFDVTIDDQVAHIRLKRPDAYNSMIRAFWNELPVIVRDINDNARARCIVISSTGKHFSAGMDLAVFGGGGSSSQEVAGASDRFIAAESQRFHVRWLQDCFSCLDEARMLLECGADLLGFPLRLPVHAPDLTEPEAREVIASAGPEACVLITYEEDPAAIVEARGMKQVTDLGAIEKAVDEIIAANPAQVEKAKQNPKLAGWFVGQVMKATGGKANPAVVNELVSAKLGL